MNATPWNAGSTFIGEYKGVRHYSRGGTIICLFGWMPKSFQSIHAFKLGVSRWLKET